MRPRHKSRSKRARFQLISCHFFSNTSHLQCKYRFQMHPTHFSCTLRMSHFKCFQFSNLLHFWKTTWDCKVCVFTSKCAWKIVSAISIQLLFDTMWPRLCGSRLQSTHNKIRYAYSFIHSFSSNNNKIKGTTRKKTWNIESTNRTSNRKYSNIQSVIFRYFLIYFLVSFFISFLFLSGMACSTVQCNLTNISQLLVKIKSTLHVFFLLLSHYSFVRSCNTIFFSSHTISSLTSHIIVKEFLCFIWMLKIVIANGFFHPLLYI